MGFHGFLLVGYFPISLSSNLSWNLEGKKISETLVGLMRFELFMDCSWYFLYCFVWLLRKIGNDGSLFVFLVPSRKLKNQNFPCNQIEAMLAVISFITVSSMLCLVAKKTVKGKKTEIWICMLNFISFFASQKL